MAEVWSQLECEAILRDYFSMFRKEIAGQDYNKAEHRRALQRLLNDRSEGSIEYKHQNISAILLEFGYPYISGYKPAHNYQGLLKEVVIGHIKAQAEDIENIASTLSESVPQVASEYDWRAVLDEAPERIHEGVAESIPDFVPTKYNYTERENRNRELGANGEEFVLRYEKHRLDIAGRDDLAKKVEWTAKVHGDGAGYDIRSFDETRATERFIEVKTTNSGKYQPFLVTKNEVAFSAMHPDTYSLYRVFNFRRHPRLFLMHGNIEQHVNLSPRVYSASF